MKIEVIFQKAAILFKYSSIVYLFIAIFYFMSLPTGGDEFLFLSDLQLIKEVGWFDAIAKNVSIPYMLLAYPLSLVLPDFMALKVVNLLLLVLLFFYLNYDKKANSNSMNYYLFFFISTVGYFYFGTNDCLFFLSLIVFLNEVNNVTIDKEVKLNVALSALIIAFFTRELFIVYCPIVCIGIYVLYKKGCRFSKNSIFPLGILIFLLLLNIPSIQKNGRLSFDKKSPPEGYSVSWSQRQYLAQLMVNKGELRDRSHPSWEETQHYLNKNGKESLPDGILNGITFDYKLTIKEFFNDLAYTMTYSFRSLGLMLLVALFYWINGMRRNKKIRINYFVPFVTLLMIMIFSFIIISFVELRWLCPVFVMTIIYYSQLEKEEKVSRYLILANYVFLCLLALYGIFRIVNKI